MTTPREFIRAVRARPGMYLDDESYRTTSTFIAGYDAGSEGLALVGFREWLIATRGGSSNRIWSDLIASLIDPGAPEPKNTIEQSRELDAQAVQLLFDLLDEFLEIRDRPEGLRRVFLEYERWLREQSWYGPDHPAWIELPEPVSARRRKKSR